MANEDRSAMTRSVMMSRIRGRDTSPELNLRQALRASGWRGYRVNVRTPGGKADLAFVSRKIAVFVDGCFWHGCPEHYVMPKSSRPFWSKKLKENVERDSRQTRELIADGWLVIRVWEHQVRSDGSGLARRIVEAVLRKRSWLATSLRVVSVSKAKGSVETRSLLRITTPEKRMVQLRVRSTHKVGVRRKLVLSATEPRSGAQLLEDAGDG